MRQGPDGWEFVMVWQPETATDTDLIITQGDVRELQKAKAAMRTGAEALMHRLGITENDISKLYMAGAFGNYVNQASAQRIGLLASPPERIHPAGNTALLGAKLALFDEPEEGGSFQALLSRIEHVPLNADASFQDIFVEELHFPD